MEAILGGDRPCSSDDERLARAMIAACRDGNQGAYRTCLEAVANRAHQFAADTTTDDAARDEFVRRCLVLAHDKRATFVDGASFLTWADAIIARAACAAGAMPAQRKSAAVRIEVNGSPAARNASSAPS
jgi:DNA-directed RNA polymerase specialized sigma24 family protein